MPRYLRTACYHIYFQNGNSVRDNFVQSFHYQTIRKINFQFPLEDNRAARNHGAQTILSYDCKALTKVRKACMTYVEVLVVPGFIIGSTIFIPAIMSNHPEKHLDLLTSQGKTKDRTSRKSNRQTVGV